MFGLIIWGNLIDNTIDPKGILLVCEGYFCLSLVFVGVLYSLKTRSEPVTNDTY